MSNSVLQLQNLNSKHQLCSSSSSSSILLLGRACDYPGYLEQSCLLGHIVPSVSRTWDFPLCTLSCSAFLERLDNSDHTQSTRPSCLHNPCQLPLNKSKPGQVQSGKCYISELNKEWGKSEGMWEVGALVCQAFGLLLYSGQPRDRWRDLRPQAEF